MTRVCKIKGFRGFVGGKDNDNVFDEGIVYEVKKIMGEILLTPIGKQPEFDGEEKIENLRLEEIICRGGYLHAITFNEDESKSELCNIYNKCVATNRDKIKCTGLNKCYRNRNK